MNSALYEFLSIVSVDTDTKKSVETEKLNYTQILEAVRSEIAKNHAAELSAALENEAAAQVLKTLIYKYTADVMSGMDYDRENMTERIYQDMAGLGVLTKYLYDPSVEEINIDSYDCIEIIHPDSTEYLYGDNAFATPTGALDIVKRMVRMGGMLLDAQTPRVDSYIGAGTRISAIIPPIVPEEAGVIVSIRKQNKNRITREQMLVNGTATEDMLDFLTLCLCNGVSVGTAGGTGSGKSTLMAFLLNEYIRLNDDHNNRVYVIEDSRELNLMKYDDENDRPARVLYTTTKGEPNPVTMFDLIVSALRFHPALIVPAEVRDGAAYQAAIAGQTGHTVLTSFHADSAEDSYRRLVALCHTAGTNLSDERLFETCIEAWPIVVHQKQLKDHSRRIMEVFEATGYSGGKVHGNPLYRYVIDDVQRDERGHILKVIGHHERCGAISPRLHKRLRDNGVSEEKLKSLFPSEVSAT